MKKLIDDFVETYGSIINCFVAIILVVGALKIISWLDK